VQFSVAGKILLVASVIKQHWWRVICITPLTFILNHNDESFSLKEMSASYGSYS
jgi:hypothetical protein